MPDELSPGVILPAADPAHALLELVLTELRELRREVADLKSEARFVFASPSPAKYLAAFNDATPLLLAIAAVVGREPFDLREVYAFAAAAGSPVWAPANYGPATQIAIGPIQPGMLSTSWWLPP